MFQRTVSLSLFVGGLLFCCCCHAREIYHVHTKAELRYTLESILYEAWKRGLNEGKPFYNLYLHTANYSIPQNNTWYRDLLKLYEKTRVLKVQPYLEISGVYPASNQPRLLVGAKLRTAILWLEEAMKSGLKITSTIRYDVHNNRQFYSALKKTRFNRNDTIIHLRYCEKENCVRDFQVLDALQNLRMPSDDGMTLRLQSKFTSLEYPKNYFYKILFYPFVYTGK